jgi:hypothetical protein
MTGIANHAGLSTCTTMAVSISATGNFPNTGKAWRFSVPVHSAE